MVRISASVEDQILLTEWLRDDDTLGRPQIEQVRAELCPDEMGLAVEALDIALGPGGTLSALATSLAVWASSRRRKVHLKIGTSEVDGSRDPDELALRLIPVLQGQST